MKILTNRWYVYELYELRKQDKDKMVKSGFRIDPAGRIANACMFSNEVRLLNAGNVIFLISSNVLCN